MPRSEGHQICTPICSWGQLTEPHNAWTISREEVQGSLTELEPSNRITKNISVVNAPIDIKEFALFHNRVHVIVGELLPLPMHEIRESIGLIRLYHYLFQNYPTSRMIEIIRNLRQLFTGKYDRPRSKECWSLAVILDDKFSSGKLKHSLQRSSGWIPQIKFINHERWYGYASSNVRTDFGGIGTFLRSFDHYVCLPPRFLHLPDLGLHRLELASHKNALPLHLMRLSRDKRQRSAEQPHLESAGYSQEKIESPQRVIHPVFTVRRYRHGGNSVTLTDCSVFSERFRSELFSSLLADSDLIAASVLEVFA